MASLLGVQQSFAQAELALAEVAGWDLDDNTIRQLCHATARLATSRRQERTTADVFAKAKAEGERPVDVEVQIDAGKVNTLGGWRDVKVGVFAVRQRGEPTTADEWDERELPSVSARSVIAAVEEASLFGDRLAAETKRLGLTDGTELTVLGDGAEWLWNLAGSCFSGAGQLLDYWHGTEYLAKAAKGVLGTGNAAAKQAFAEGKSKLLRDGYWGVTEWIGSLGGQLPVGGDGASLGEALNYFGGQKERLNYALRLHRGQSIGSGMVEGSIKQLLNKRLKQTGARWKVEHVGPFVELGALANGPEWPELWENK